MPDARALKLAQSAYWVRKWKQGVSGWLQVITMSDTLLRQTYLVPLLCIGPIN